MCFQSSEQQSIMVLRIKYRAVINENKLNAIVIFSLNRFWIVLNNLYINPYSDIATLTW